MKEKITDRIKIQLLSMIVSAVFKYLTEDRLKKYADKLLDAAEEAIQDSGTKLDDTILLPAIGLVRKAFDVPDQA
jgi:hypothetical protein